VQNPIGLKCGPTTTEDDLKVLMAKLNPENEAGRLTLIARFGAGKVGEHLPRLIRDGAGRGRNVSVVLRSDARQHIKSSTGYKTRPFERSCARCRSSSPSTAPRARCRAACISR
jgi:3-deoxy-7-phosphoheptulonate synthase